MSKKRYEWWETDAVIYSAIVLVFIIGSLIATR